MRRRPPPSRRACSRGGVAAVREVPYLPGKEMAEWQGALAGYLLGIVAGDRYPYLAAALAGHADGAGQADRARPTDGAGQAPETAEVPLPVFDRTLTRILTGLLTAIEH
jgi:hypothetical protein